MRLYAEQKIDKYVVYATKFLGLVFEVNSAARKGLLRAAFYNDAINSELDIKHDYIRWRKKQSGDFSFCDCAYILDPASKQKVLPMNKAAAQTRSIYRCYNTMQQFNSVKRTLNRSWHSISAHT